MPRKLLSSDSGNCLHLLVPIFSSLNCCYCHYTTPSFQLPTNKVKYASLPEQNAPQLRSSYFSIRKCCTVSAQYYISFAHFPTPSVSDSERRFFPLSFHFERDIIVFGKNTPQRSNRVYFRVVEVFKAFQKCDNAIIICK